MRPSTLVTPFIIPPTLPLPKRLRERGQFRMEMVRFLTTARSHPLTILLVGSSASGDVYTDTITLADIAIPGQGIVLFHCLAAETKLQSAIELAKKLSSSFLSDGGSDGLLGLAWPSACLYK
jgi:hypothetical protein